MNNSPIRVTSLSPEKSKLLELLLEEDGVQTPAQRITRRGAEIDSLPLSFAQQRLWLLDQLFPGNPAYNESFTIRLSGRLEAPALGRSLDEIIRRHEALRTTYIDNGGAPAQKINPPAPLDLPMVDLGDLTALAQETRLKELVVEQTQSPFSLSEGPLVRAKLLRLADDKHVLLLTMSHICTDGWSMDVFYREMAVLYEAFSAGRRSPLTELPIQYADYAVWQRRRMRAEVLERQLEYWRERLRGPLPQFTLPTDHAFPPVPSGKGRRLRHVLPDTLAAALRDFCGRQRATLYHTLLAAFQALFHRYTGDTDILIGSPAAGRSGLEIESLIGFFVNTLALRADLSGDPSFAELVGRAREAALAAYERQELPFERLVEELQPERALSHNPLFQVMFVMQEKAETAGRMGQVDYVAEWVDGGAVKFPLDLWAQERGAAIELQLGYSSDLFEENTARRMLGHYERLLKSALTEPARRLSELGMLAEDECREVVEGFNQTRAEYPADLCLHELFERQVGRAPDAVAVGAGDELLTYAELNERAEMLARRLKSLGVGPESLVAVMAERSAWLVVALLGALKAGGAYVPLDPSYPAERLSFMLQDSGARVLLAQQALLGNIAAPGLNVVIIDAPGDGAASPPDYSAPREACAQNLAYLIYTSGSTGKPKGTMIPHRGLVNYLSWCLDAYRVADGNGAPVHSSVGFDLTVTSLFAPLLAGRQIVMMPETESVEALAEALRVGNDFSLVKLTPSHLQMLNQLLPAAEAAGSVRALVIGGEELRAESIAFWRAYAPETRLINEYGPTETVVGCCTHEVGVEDAPEGSIPIGRPIANTQHYLLDPKLQPVPVGVVGELYIGGDGLGRGYWGRPELTAERFVPSPFGAEPGARLYRTGDSARWLPDGKIEYMGRMDRQVKIRGFRIELGEIESLLRKHAGVSEAVVIVKAGAGGDKRLVAYIVDGIDSGLDDSPTPSELRKWLGRQLPDYMVPTAFVKLDSLPLTPNGKLDHKALPEPEPGYSLDDSEQTAPRTQTEEAVANIWAEILGAERVGANVTFFELGGHSLLAAQIVSRLRDAFQIDIPLRRFFEGLTVTSLASSIETIQKEREAEMRAGVLEMLNQFSEEELEAELSRRLSSHNEK
jgi:amino acid adenylation domain-containing protein